MSNPLDTDAGSEMFASYETELKLVQADLNQKLDQISEASGEQRKSAIRSAEQVLDEATELVCLAPEPSNRSLSLPFNVTQITRPPMHRDLRYTCELTSS